MTVYYTIMDTGIILALGAFTIVSGLINLMIVHPINKRIDRVETGIRETEARLQHSIGSTDKRIDDTNKRIDGVQTEIRESEARLQHSINSSIDSTGKRIDDTNKRIEELRAETKDDIRAINTKLDNIVQMIVFGKYASPRVEPQMAVEEESDKPYS